MPMTYDTDRGVFFNPAEVTIDKCFKCARPTTRRSPRTIASLVRGNYGAAVRSMRGALTLCEACDRRWDRAVGIGFASFATPFAFPMLAVLIHMKVTHLPGSAFGLAFVLGFGVAIAMYVYAVRASIRVRSIDDDGLIGLDQIHPEVRAEIVAAGDAAHTM
jgi:hypothetical protein